MKRIKEYEKDFQKTDFKSIGTKKVNLRIKNDRDMISCIAMVR